MLKYIKNILRCPNKRKINHFEDDKESPIYSKIAINDMFSFLAELFSVLIFRNYTFVNKRLSKLTFMSFLQINDSGRILTGSFELSYWTS
jgi:prophage maintenance system killer protein